MRYPLLAGAEPVNQPIAFNAQPTNLRFRDSVVIGSVKSSPVEVTNSRGSQTDKGFAAFTLTQAWLDANAPYPSRAALAAFWK